MQWRKEGNGYIDSSVRGSLTYTERDIYHCLRCLAGSDMGRQGYIERNELQPTTIAELSYRIGEAEEAIQSTFDKLETLGYIEQMDGHYHFVSWDEEQAIQNPGKKRSRPRSPQEKEYYDRMSLSRLMTEYPDEVTKVVDIRLKAILEGGADSE